VQGLEFKPQFFGTGVPKNSLRAYYLQSKIMTAPQITYCTTFTDKEAESQKI
jgi:hypothetical protein